MHLKFFRYCLFFQSVALISFFSGILVMLSGCKSIDSKAKPNLFPHILKPVAFVTSSPPNNLKKAWPEMMKNVEKKLRKLPHLGKFIGLDEQDQKLRKKPMLRSEFMKFLNMLSLTGFSDKKIAWKMEQNLGSKYFLFLDFSSFSCSQEGCTSNQQWIIRLKMIESRSSNLIFWVRKKYELSDNEINTESYHQLAEKIILEVINEFASGFIVPWHQWRYFHLSPDSSRKDRSTIGV